LGPGNYWIWEIFGSGKYFGPGNYQLTLLIRPIYFTCKNIKSIALTVSEIFTDLLAEYTWGKITLVKELWCCKVVVANATYAAAVAHWWSKA
jgi:hypothetical protein